MTHTARLLIVEDDAVTAREMADHLTGAGFATVSTGSIADGVKTLKSGPFDAVVLDRMLPDGDGAEAIRRFRDAAPGVMVLVVSALGRSANRVQGLDLGADDYLAKPFDPDELTARLRAVLRRPATREDDDLIAFGPLQIRKKARTVHVADKHVPLSPREFDLLLFFARHHGDVVTRMQLLEHVWNLHFDPQTNVVDVHVSRLRRKLDAAMPMPVLHTQRGEGYVFDPARAALG